jgi:hypothetical protein
MKIAHQFTMLLMLITTSTLFPQVRQNQSTDLDRFHRLASLLILPPRVNSLAKCSKDLKATSPWDSLVISKIDVYGWRDEQWNFTWGYTIIYDAMGRFTGCTMYPSTDSAFEHRTYTYDDIHHIAQEKFEARQGSSTQDALTIYYFNDRSTYTIPRPPSLSLPFVDLLPFKHAAFDSVVYSFGTNGADTSVMEGSMVNKYSYSYSNDNTVISLTHGVLTPETKKYRIDETLQYKILGINDDLVDTVEYSTMSDGVSYQLTNLITYRYMDRRLISLTHEWTYASGAPETFYFDFSYTPEGMISSYTQQYTSDYTTSRTNIERVVYTYSTISVACKSQQPLSHTAAAPCVTWRQGRLHISAPEGMHIFDVSCYDFSGRLLTIIREPRRLTPKEFIIPFKLGRNAIQLARMRTNQGVFTLKIRSR